VLLIAAAWIAVGMKDRAIPAVRLTPEEAARQRANEEYEARVVLADAALSRAVAAASGARGFRRRRAEKKVDRARAEREALRHADPSSEAPRKL
jgi:membrane protein